MVNFYFLPKENDLILYISSDIDVNEDETLSIKYPSISTINWDVLTCVDNQMEEALQQCQQDFIEYEQFFVFQNMIKEVSILIRSVFFYCSFVFPLF
jgi:hypothetical protein